MPDKIPSEPIKLYTLRHPKESIKSIDRYDSAIDIEPPELSIALALPRWPDAKYSATSEYERG